MAEVYTPVLSANTFEEILPKLDSQELQTLAEGIVEDQRKKFKEVKIIAQLQKRVIANIEDPQFDQLEIWGEALENEIDLLKTRLELVGAEREHRLHILELETQAPRLEFALAQ